MTDLLTLKRGDFVRVTAAGRTCLAMVGLASENGHSLMLLFEGMIGGYVGAMPVLYHEGAYRGIVDQLRVHLEHATEFQKDGDA